MVNTATLAEALRDGRSLVVVKPSSLGDVVHTLPVVRLIKEAFPWLEIHWVVNTEWAPLVDGNPDLAGVVRFPRREIRGPRGLGALLRFRRALRTLGRPDVVLDFQGLLRSALIGRSLRAPVFVGLSDAREGAGGFYTHTIPVGSGEHAIDRYLAVAEAVGIQVPRGGGLVSPLPEKPLDEKLSTALPQGAFVVLHPYARGQGKALTGMQVDAFIRSVAPVPVVIVGAASPRFDSLPSSAIDLTGETDLAGLVAVLRRAAYTVSVDSGPMHIAAALGDRLLGIHTWTDPRKVGPYPASSHVWKGGKISERGSVTPSQCEMDSPMTQGDLEEIGRFVRGMI